MRQRLHSLVVEESRDRLVIRACRGRSIWRPRRTRKPQEKHRMSTQEKLPLWRLESRSQQTSEEAVSLPLRNSKVSKVGSQGMLLLHDPASVPRSKQTGWALSRALLPPLIRPLRPNPRHSSVLRWHASAKSIHESTPSTLQCVPHSSLLRRRLSNRPNHLSLTSHHPIWLVHTTSSPSDLRQIFARAIRADPVALSLSRDSGGHRGP